MGRASCGSQSTLVGRSTADPLGVVPQKLRWEFFGITVIKLGKCNGEKKPLLHLAPKGISPAHPHRCLVRIMRTTWGGAEPVIVVDPRSYAITANSDQALLSLAKALGLNVSPEPYLAP